MPRGAREVSRVMTRGGIVQSKIIVGYSVMDYDMRKERGPPGKEERCPRTGVTFGKECRGNPLPLACSMCEQTQLALYVKEREYQECSQTAMKPEIEGVLHEDHLRMARMVNTIDSPGTQGGGSLAYTQ